MPKCLGGYQIVDLKGQDLASVTFDDVSWFSYALKLRKPVYLTNYEDSTNVLKGPLLLQYDEGNEMFFYIAVSSSDGSPIATINIYDDGDGLALHFTEL